MNTSNAQIVEERKLIAHTAPIMSVAVDRDGLLLFSGDEDSFLRVWDLKNGILIQTIENKVNGPVTAITYVEIGDDRTKGIAFGCVDGSIHVYRQDVALKAFTYVVQENAHDGQVEDMHFCPKQRLLCSVGGKSPQLWRLSSTGALQAVLKDPPHYEAQAKAIRVCENGSEVAVFFMENHEIICYTIEPWGTRLNKFAKTRIGSATLCSAEDGQHAFISNLSDGVDQYRFPSMEKVQSFRFNVQEGDNVFNLRVVACENTPFVICGGIDGVARVFDRRSGELFKKLKHGGANDHVQVVTLFERDRDIFFISAGSGNGKSDLKIWRYRSDAFNMMKPIRNILGLISSLRWRMKVILFIIFQILFSFVVVKVGTVIKSKEAPKALQNFIVYIFSYLRH